MSNGDLGAHRIEAGIRARDAALEAFAAAACRAVFDGPAPIAAPAVVADRARGSSGCRCDHLTIGATESS